MGEQFVDSRTQRSLITAYIALWKGWPNTFKSSTLLLRTWVPITKKK